MTSSYSVSRAEQMQSMRRGLHMVVSTPGRLLDMLNAQKVIKKNQEREEEEGQGQGNKKYLNVKEKKEKERSKSERKKIENLRNPLYLIW